MSPKRIITIAFYVLVLIISVVGLVKIFGSSSLGTTPEEMLGDNGIQSGTGILIILSIVLMVIIAAVTFLLSPVLNIIQNPKGFLRSLVGVGVLLVVFLIGYAMAGEEVTPVYQSMGIDTPGKSKMIGGMLNATYAFMVFGILAYAYSSVNSLLKQI